MKTLFVLLAVAAFASMATVDAKALDKRFFIQDVLDFFKATYNKAKDAFNSLLGGIDFDAAVDLLIPYINAAMTVNQCVSVCSSVATTILGPLSVSAALVCEPLCEGALAKLEQVIG